MKIEINEAQRVELQRAMLDLMEYHSRASRAVDEANLPLDLWRGLKADLQMRAEDAGRLARLFQSEDESEDD